MNVIRATEAHVGPLVRFCKALWDDAEDALRDEVNDIFRSDGKAAFLLQDVDGTFAGFIYGVLYLEGTKPYGFVEAWYVEPAFRGQGHGAQLMSALEQWILHHSISLMLSDTIPSEYPRSPKAHADSGFRTLMDVRVFIKELGNYSSSDELTQ